MRFIDKIIIGACAGWTASRITHTKNKGCIGNIMIGSLGSILGNWICARIFNVTIVDFSFRSFVISLIGSVLLLAIFGRKK